MTRWFDRSSPMGMAEVESDEDRALERQRAARRLAEQSWGEFFVSLGVRTVVIVAIVLAIFLVLRVLFR